MRRGGTVTDRGEGTRKHILDVASRVFAEKGYGGASFTDLIADSGLTKGAFYFHFPSKEALAMAAFAHTQEKWLAMVLAVVDPAAPAVDQLRSMLRAAVQFHAEEPSSRCVSRLCFELGQIADHRPALVPYLTTWEQMAEELIRRAQREGDFREDIDAVAAARVSVAAFIGMEDVSEVVSAGGDLGVRAEEFLHVFMTGLGATPGGAKKGER